MIDYRSDTFTRPTSAMLEAMMRADVGDDVFQEDPSVNKLEALAVDMFGMEAAVFCPGGTMTNQIAIKCHTNPGDEVICEKLSHVYVYEGGGISFNSGASVRTIDGDRGRITSEQILDEINPEDIHKPHTRLVTLENTANRGGGSCYNFGEIEKIRQLCDEHGLSLHLDGARLFNALVAKNEKPRDYGRVFHSISICLSKGLGVPVGSVLLGTKDFIYKARRIRKVLGGGMRQAGFLAAAGIYALQNNVERLANDHKHAWMIADALQKKDFVGVINPVETNILIFELQGRFTPQSFTDKLAEQEIKVMAISKSQVRMVLHLDVSEEMVRKTIEVIENM